LSSSFRKSIRRSLFGSEPKSFLKPKSVKKLIYRSFMPRVPGKQLRPTLPLEESE
jgi:hypothetical protein